MLNYISTFESVHVASIIGLGVIAIIFSVGFNVRRGLLVEDVKAEHEMRRKIEWKNIEDRKVIEGKR